MPESAQVLLRRDVGAAIHTNTQAVCVHSSFIRREKVLDRVLPPPVPHHPVPPALDLHSPVDNEMHKRSQTTTPKEQRLPARRRQRAERPAAAQVTHLRRLAFRAFANVRPRTPIPPSAARSDQNAKKSSGRKVSLDSTARRLDVDVSRRPAR